MSVRAETVKIAYGDRAVRDGESLEISGMDTFQINVSVVPGNYYALVIMRMGEREPYVVYANIIQDRGATTRDEIINRSPTQVGEYVVNLYDQGEEYTGMKTFPALETFLTRGPIKSLRYNISRVIPTIRGSFSPTVTRTTRRSRSPTTTRRSRSPTTIRTVRRSRSPTATATRRSRSPTTTRRSRSPTTTRRSRSPTATRTVRRSRSPTATATRRSRSPTATATRRSRSPTATATRRSRSPTTTRRKSSSRSRSRSPTTGLMRSNSPKIPSPLTEKARSLLRRSPGGERMPSPLSENARKRLFETRNKSPTSLSRSPSRKRSPSPSHRKSNLSEDTKRRLFEEELPAKEAKWCSCVVGVASKGTARNPYAVCAKSVGTTSRRCAIHYDYNNWTDDELRGYAKVAKVRLPVPYSREELIRKLIEKKSPSPKRSRRSPRKSQ